MAQITYSELQLIVENAMRENGMKGKFEDGWKSTLIDGSGGTIQNEYNFQNMRDATAKAILDALTGVTVTGTISQGNTQGVQARVGNSGQINLSSQSVATPALALPAARTGDAVVIDNAIFLAWIVTISAAVNSLSSGSVPVVPVVVDGKITGGSSNVAIGDSNVQIGS